MHSTWIVAFSVMKDTRHFPINFIGLVELFDGFANVMYSLLENSPRIYDALGLIWSDFTCSVENALCN